MGDGLFNEDSQSEDFSPDFEFEVVTGRFAGGWTAEFRIPFSSLRFADPPSSDPDPTHHVEGPRVYDQQAIPRRIAGDPASWLLFVPQYRQLAIVRLTLVTPPRTTGT